MNAAYSGLVDHFGVELATRIYSCAMLTHIYEAQGIAVAVRYTVGILKRMRKQRTTHTTWAECVDRLEMEQVEGRHYSMDTAANSDIQRIEAYNKQTNAERKAVGYVMQAVQAEQDRYNNSPEEQLQVKLWVEAYLSGLPSGKCAYLARVLRTYKARKELGRKTAENLRINYAPRGVGAATFVEVIAKYA